MIDQKTKKELILEDMSAGMDPKDVAAKHGVGYAYVKRISKEAGLWAAGPRKRGPTPNHKLPKNPISKLHQQIGRDLYFYRDIHNHISYREAGVLFNMSMTNVQRAELGLHEFRLSELKKISEVLGKPLDLLTKEEPTTIAGRAST